VSLKSSPVIHVVEGWVLSYILGIVRIVYCCVNNWSRVCVFGMSTRLGVQCLLDRASLQELTNDRPTWCHLLFYFTYYVLNTSHQTHTTIHRKFTLKLNHPSLQNKTTDVAIQQHSRKLLKMDILMSETCWAH